MPLLQQIDLSYSRDVTSVATPKQVDADTLKQEYQTAVDSLVKSCPAVYWPGTLPFHCPWPILTTTRHQQQLADLSDTLHIAIANIVDRWWSDKGARLPERMPIEPLEEELLQWLEDTGFHQAHPYAGRQGSWRPDFLLEENEVGAVSKEEGYRICEINARFAFNGYLHITYGQQALIDNGLKSKNLRGCAEPIDVSNGLLDLFDTFQPLHLLKGKEQGIDIPMFMHHVERRIGGKPRLILPSDLRLVPDDRSKTGFRLFCVSDPELPTKGCITCVVDGEILEEIHQVGLELHQHELMALPLDMLRQIATCCFNDMRTILLVHDKRMLGIIFQELDDLVGKHKVLTQAQADILRRGIAHSILPGSQEMEELIKDCEIDATAKDNFILKPVRGGKGAGILFGDELSSQEWLAYLHGLQTPQLKPDVTNFVVQKKIVSPRYDLLLRQSEGFKQYPLIGTYHTINGVFLGLGTWRGGPGRVVAISRGGAWICSVMPNEESTQNADEVVEKRQHLTQQPNTWEWCKSRLNLLTKKPSAIFDLLARPKKEEV